MQTYTGTAFACSHLLQFRSLHGSGQGFVFTCNAQGYVDLNALGEQARINYLFARAVVGRDLAPPAVVACH